MEIAPFVTYMGFGYAYPRLIHRLSTIYQHSRYFLAYVSQIIQIYMLITYLVE